MDDCLKLYDTHLYLIRYVTKGVRLNSDEFQDLLQTCRLELWSAVCNFKRDKGVLFSGYAMHYLINEVKRYYRSIQHQQIHIPAYVYEKGYRIDTFYMSDFPENFHFGYEINYDTVTYLQSKVISIIAKLPISLLQKKAFVYYLIFEYSRQTAAESFGISATHFKRVVKKYLPSIAKKLEDTRVLDCLNIPCYTHH